MAFQMVPECVLAELIFETNGQRTENTLWLNVGAEPNDTYLFNVAGALATWWTTELADSISQDCSLVEVVATWKGDDNGPQAINSVGLPDTGNVPTPSTANGTAFVVKFGTANIGRSFRGRNYIAGLPASIVVASEYTIAGTNPVLSAYASLTAVLEPFNAFHVVVSRWQGGNLRPFAINTPVTSYTATTRATRSQRRRNPGIGG